MTRSIVYAAVAAAAISLAVPAQAITANPGLNSAAPAALQLAYYHHHSYRHRSWRHSYAYVPYRHRHCWNERVWRWHHWQWVSRCSW